MRIRNKINWAPNAKEYLSLEEALKRVPIREDGGGLIEQLGEEADQLKKQVIAIALVLERNNLLTVDDVNAMLDWSATAEEEH